MAQHTRIELRDDIDHGPAQHTIRFGYEGRLYEIDLSEQHAADLDAALRPWVERARHVGGRRRPSRHRSGYDVSCVRRWAQSNGYEVADRGPVPAEIFDAYDAAC